MIVPVAAVSATQPVQQNANTAVLGVPTETSLLARIPFRAVPATISNSEVFNNTKTSVPVRDSQNSAPQASFAQAATTTSALRRASTAPRYGFSTLFMTQVMGQSNANDNALVRAFYDAESLFQAPGSEVKHLPSNASKPDPVPHGNAKLSMPIDRPVVDQEFAKVQPSVKPITVNIPDVPAPKIANTSSSQVAAVVPKIQVPEAPQPAIKTEGSLVRSSGTQAYQDTFSRNMLSMGEIEPDTVEVSV
ncbi:MAG: hypothetical protein MRY32_02900 [Rickettsiales bacterium]|nr:hypothetical protein [Rickettsiales bacterium]